MLPSPDQNLKIGSVGQFFFFFFFFFFFTYRERVEFSNILLKVSKWGKLGRNAVKTHTCTSAFLSHWIQILANSSPKSDIKFFFFKPTLFFRILRSVRRGQHKKNFGGPNQHYSRAVDRVMLLFMPQSHLHVHVKPPHKSHISLLRRQNFVPQKCLMFRRAIKHGCFNTIMNGTAFLLPCHSGSILGTRSFCFLCQILRRFMHVSSCINVEESRIWLLELSRKIWTLLYLFRSISAIWTGKKSSFLATSLYKKVIFTKNWVTRSCHPHWRYDNFSQNGFIGVGHVYLRQLRHQGSE